MLYLFLILSHSTAHIGEVSKSKTIPKNLTQARASIMKIQPNLTNDDAQIIAEAIIKHSRHYGLDWKILASIIAQESSFRKDPQNCLNSKAKCPDLGLAQINYRTWKKELCLDRTRLLIDISYNIETMAQILSQLKSKYGKKEKNWFTRYHSFTTAHRTKYANFLHNHLNKINQGLPLTNKDIRYVAKQ